MKLPTTHPASSSTPFPLAGAPLRPARDVVFEAFLSHLCGAADRIELGATRAARGRFEAAVATLETRDARSAAHGWLESGQLGEGLSRPQLSRLFRPVRDQLTRQLGPARCEELLASALRVAERLPESACFSPLEIY